MDQTELLRVLIADDEELSREALRYRLEDVPDVEIIAECSDGDAVAATIQSLHPDVVFLDIEMPGRSGIEAIRVADGHRPAVIFVTGHPDYALGAFEAAALDYLLKPVDTGRLLQALDRAREYVSQREVVRLHRRATALEDPTEIAVVIGTGPEPLRHAEVNEYLKRIVVRDDGDFVIIDVSDVWALEAAGNYVRVRTADRRFLVRGTLSGYEQRLDPQRFVRIHRSTVVAVDHVERITPEPHGDFVVTLRSGDRYRMSRSHRSRLLP